MSDVFSGGGTMAALLRSLDWAATSLGPVEDWPQSLRTAVGICLNASLPIAIWWGAEYILFYNDACLPFLGASDAPRAPGQPGRESWPDLWGSIAASLGHVLETGSAATLDDQLLLVEQNGNYRHYSLTFSCSPILGENDAAEGVFCVITASALLENSGPPQLSVVPAGGSANGHKFGHRDAAEVVTERLHRILESIRDDFVMYDDEWRYVYVNEKAAQSLGYAREQLIGQRIWDLFPGAVGNLFYQQMLRAQAERRDIVFEHYYAPWGKWIENRAYPMPDGMLLFATDITERKQAEAALRESEQRFRFMADAAPVLIWISGLDKLCTWFNRQWLEFVGRTMEQELGNGWTENVHAADYDRCLQTYSTAFDAHEPFSMEYRLRRHDGVYRWVLDQGQPLYAAEGAFMGYIGSCVDISERKQLELNAQFLLDLDTQINRLTEPTAIEQEVVERLAAYLDVAGCYFGHIDGDWLTIRQKKRQDGYLPSRRYRLSDYLTAEALAQLRAHQALVVEDVATNPYTKAIAAKLQGIGINAFISLPVIYQDHWVGLLSITSPYRRNWRSDKIGLLREVVARVWPLLEQAQARAALYANEARLQLLYTQERAARAQAEEASRLKDEFLATVSHELRTPLTAFLGYAQLLQRRPRDEDYVKRTVAKLVQRAQDQAQLIEDLLDVSRIVTGMLHIEMQPVDLVRVVQTALDTVRPTVEAKGLHLHVKLNPHAGAIIGDTRRLQQVVWNLLSNATKFTPRGGSILVRLEPDDGDAQLIVSDNGQGIDPAFLPYVFDRFRQADSTSTRVQGGLGLGLAIVRHLIELHGGTVQAASAGVGQGASFTIRLPRMPADRMPSAETEPDRASVPGLVEHCPPELAGMRILLVDDQLDILELLSEILIPCGAVVRTCTAAREALELVQSWKPDVLVSDIAMPGDDGYWLIRNLRALAPEDGGTIPAAALTAYVRLEERLRVLATGFQQYVPKPVNLDDFPAMIVQLVQMTV